MSEPPVNRPFILGNNRRKRYESLVDNFYQDVFRYAYWLTRNPAIAEDLVQETFLRAWRSFDSLQSEDAAKAWAPGASSQPTANEAPSKAGAGQLI
jgi:RNA polymerase sigma-70 factor (ECF subfamily)